MGTTTDLPPGYAELWAAADLLPAAFRGLIESIVGAQAAADEAFAAAERLEKGTTDPDLKAVARRLLDKRPAADEFLGRLRGAAEAYRRKI